MSSEKQKQAVSKSISLPPAYWDIAKKIALGNVSLGIRIALAFYSEHHELKEVQLPKVEESN